MSMLSSMSMASKMTSCQERKENAMADLMRDDATIRNNVLDEMDYDPAVTVNDIAVVVENGVVTLSGVADSYGTRTAAALATWRVLGVRDVINTIVVDPTLLGQPTDDQIAADLRQRLDKDFLVPKGRISVSVADGVVTLKGAVKLHLQREAAVEEAEDAAGVRSVINLIEIDRSAPSPTNIEGDINRALTRSAQVDASKILVAADGGHVTLSGVARSFAERQEAENAAWRASGVTDVTDNITIQLY
jgi:osmotically-inducible protein OsmY